MVNFAMSFLAYFVFVGLRRIDICLRLFYDGGKKTACSRNLRRAEPVSEKGCGAGPEIPEGYGDQKGQGEE
jgi:hypothetical protein